jgi:hypothetical protein
MLTAMLVTNTHHLPRGVLQRAIHLPAKKQ